MRYPGQEGIASEIFLLGGNVPSSLCSGPAALLFFHAIQPVSAIVYVAAWVSKSGPEGHALANLKGSMLLVGPSLVKQTVDETDMFNVAPGANERPGRVLDSLISTISVDGKGKALAQRPNAGWAALIANLSLLLVLDFLMFVKCLEYYDTVFVADLVCQRHPQLLLMRGSRGTQLSRERDCVAKCLVCFVDLFSMPNC